MSLAFLPLVALVTVVTDVQAHGHMIDPISRSSLAKFGYNVPFNPYYNGLDCQRTYDVDDGKQCGVCGDPYNAPVHDNEAGGKYAKGIITRNYTAGQIIDIKLEITVPHLGGWSEFKICPNNDYTRVVSQACLDAQLLATPSGVTRHYHPTYSGTLTFHLQLPRDLTCTQCVIQWTWKANQNNNCRGGINCCVACGVQEHFRNCADVAIHGSTNPTSPPQSHDRNTSPTRNLLTTTMRNSLCKATPIGRENYGTMADAICLDKCTRGLCPFPLMCSDACRDY